MIQGTLSIEVMFLVAQNLLRGSILPADDQSPICAMLRLDEAQMSFSVVQRYVSVYDSLSNLSMGLAPQAAEILRINKSTFTGSR